MSDTDTNKWLKGAILIVGLAVVASSAAMMVSGSSHVTTEQTANATSVQPGETVNLTVTLDTPSDFNSPGLDVDLPENWSVVSQSSSGTYRPSEVQWVWLSGGEKTVEYTVEVPEDATQGTYQVVANGSTINGSTGETVADENVTEISVETDQANQPPTADFTVDPSEPTVGEGVELFAAASSDPDGIITSYEWDTDDDGNYDDGVGIEQFVTFDSAGEKTVGLRVTDDDSATDTVQKTITVGSSAPPAAVTFTNQTTDGTTVTIDSVRMDEGGFVTMHNESLFEGDPIGSVVGVSEYLAPGTYQDVTISLDEPLEETQTLVAMPHKDTNGNQTYDFVETAGSEDAPYTANGSAVVDDAVITLGTPTFEVSNLSAPATAPAGATATVTATVTNIGNAEDTIDANFVFAGDTFLTESVALDAGASTEVSFEVPTAGIAPGTYEHGIEVGNSSQFADITLEVPTDFQTILDGREDPDGPKQVNLSQFVEGDTVRIKFADHDTSDGLGAQLVSFDIRADGESIATIDSGVGVDDEFILDGAGNPTQPSNIRFADANDFFTYEFVVPEDAQNLTATINVNNEFLVDARSASDDFEVSNLSAPGTATVGDTIEVTATIANVGTADNAETTNAEFVFGGDVLLSQRVSLDAGNSTEVSFEVSTTVLAGGSYTHGIRAGDDFQTAQIGIDEPPTASFSATPESPEANQTVTLNATDSTDGDGNITSYEWDLDGDGQYDDATGPTVDVEYNSSGERTIGLRVTDDDGLTNETSVTVDVGESSETISADQPGFGVGVALVALLVAFLVVRRRD